MLLRADGPPEIPVRHVLSLGHWAGEAGFLELGGDGDLGALRALLPFVTRQLESARVLAILMPSGRAATAAGVLRQLSPRQRETLACVLQGASEKETADRLGLSTHTVHQYMKALYRSFGVHTRSELMARFLGG